MAAHVRRQREHRRILGNLARRPRLFRDRSNPLEDLDPEEVFKRYRFRPPTILYILEIILPVQRPTNRNCPLPPLLQLLLCLRFLATGSIHVLIGDSLNISRSTAGRCIRDVAERICVVARRFIKFPAGRAADETKTAFSKIAGFKMLLVFQIPINKVVAYWSSLSRFDVTDDHCSAVKLRTFHNLSHSFKCTARPSVCAKDSKIQLYFGLNMLIRPLCNVLSLKLIRCIQFKISYYSDTPKTPYQQLQLSTFDPSRLDLPSARPDFFLFF